MAGRRLGWHFCSSSDKAVLPPPQVTIGGHPGPAPVPTAGFVLRERSCWERGCSRMSLSHPVRQKEAGTRPQIRAGFSALLSPLIFYIPMWPLWPETLALVSERVQKRWLTCFSLPSHQVEKVKQGWQNSSCHNPCLAHPPWFLRVHGHLSLSLTASLLHASNFSDPSGSMLPLLGPSLSHLPSVSCPISTFFCPVLLMEQITSQLND